MILPQGRKKKHKDVSFLLLFLLYHRRLFAPAKEGGREETSDKGNRGFDRSTTPLRPSSERDRPGKGKKTSLLLLHSLPAVFTSLQPSSCRPPPPAIQTKIWFLPLLVCMPLCQAGWGTRGRVVSCPRSPPFPKRRKRRGGGHKMGDGFR